MPIAIICPCSAKMKVADGLRGPHVRRRRCGVVLPVGETRPAPAPAPAGRIEPNLPEEERERLREELQPGERLLWAGKPVVEAGMARRWFVLAPFYAGAFLMLVVCIILLVMGVARDVA